MNIVFHRAFEKEYKKLKKSERERLTNRLDLFTADPFDVILNNHSLGGVYKGYRSINVGGDLRAIYKEIKPETFVFITIGTHAKLYS